MEKEDEGSGRFFLFGVIDLSFIQCFDTISRVTVQAPGM